MNMFIPSMPGLVRVFETDYATVQLALTLYLFSLAVSQLFVGDLSDRYGRRPVMLWGLALFFLGSVVCMAAPNVDTLILGRMTQAVGGCTGLVLSRSIIRDLHGLEGATSMIAYVTMVMVIAPILAPSVGGLLDSTFNWQAGFVVLSAYAAGLFSYSFYRLKETHKGPFQSGGPGQMLIGFGFLLRRWRFIRYSLQISFSSAAFFSFLGGAPYVMVEIMGRTTAEYGLYFMFGGAFYMLGNFLSVRKAAVWGAPRLLWLGATVGLAGGLLLLAVFLRGSLGPVSLFGAMAVIALANGCTLPAGTACAIGVDHSRIGAAAGLSGFMQIATGALGAFLVGTWLSDSAAPLVYVMAISMGIAFAVHLAGEYLEGRLGRSAH